MAALMRRLPNTHEPSGHSLHKDGTERNALAAALFTVMKQQQAAASSMTAKIGLPQRKLECDWEQRFATCNREALTAGSPRNPCAGRLHAWSKDKGAFRFDRLGQWSSHFGQIKRGRVKSDKESETSPRAMS